MIANRIETRRRAVSHHMSRRDALGRVAAAGLGIAAVFKGEAASAAAAQRAAGASAARRTSVNTVLGPIESSKLGLTLSHEHINASSAGIWQAWPELLGGRAKFVAAAVDQLKRAKDEGVSSIIDCTTIDLGRDIRLMEEISRKSGMQVIAATGHWLDPSNTMRARTIEELTDFFVREITVGIEGTGIKAGVIKVANGAMIDAFGETAARRVAREQGDGPADDDALAGGAAGRRKAGGHLRGRRRQPVEGLHRPHRQQPRRLPVGARAPRLLPRHGPVAARRPGAAGDAAAGARRADVGAALRADQGAR